MFVKVLTTRASISQGKTPAEVSLTRYGCAMRRKPTETTVSATRRRVNAVK
ncbi:MAG: hypothetical protein BWX50_01533 [Euryarchaeota archaeon ADurb.Bin009]|nr:MAG: hypothetical protein BWX50_01533 [Euryarchaeota archaeon ADurb.Bin009]